MKRQLDIFAAAVATGPANPLVGLLVKLDRPVDRDRPCCLNVCKIGPAKGPHAGELLCAGCGQHRGWLSKSTAHWIEGVISRFGAPEVITIRPRTSFPQQREETAATASVNATATETGVRHG